MLEENVPPLNSIPARYQSTSLVPRGLVVYNAGSTTVNDTSTVALRWQPGREPDSFSARMKNLKERVPPLFGDRDG